MAKVETVVTVSVENTEGEVTALNLTHQSAADLRDALIQSIGRPRFPRGPRAVISAKPPKSRREKAGLMIGASSD